MNQGKKRISTSFLQDFSAIGWLFLIAIAVIAVLCPAGSTNAFSGKLDLSTMVGSFVALDGDTLPKRVTSGQPTRRSRARQMREGKIDTTGMRDKEVARQDTSYKMMRDSSARLAHFLYMRRDKPYVDPLKPMTHSLFLSDPNVITYTEEMDTTTYQFKVRSMFGFKDIKEPITLSFDEYRSVRMSRAIRENWEALAQSYVLESEKKKGLGDLFGNVTNIEIPVPKNPLFSIFGPNRIRLNINGSVDIHGAFRNIKSDLLTTNPF